MIQYALLVALYLAKVLNWVVSYTPYCMESFEVLILGLSAVSCTGICAWAWYQSQVKAAIISQQGIDRRAAARLGGENSTSSPYNKTEWWVPLATELMKNPQIQDMILKKVAPTLIGETKSS